MRAEIVAVGTELLLGQIVDTNSTYIAGELAAAGIDCLFQTRVGDNLDRITEAFRLALTRADAVIVCGGLGPTQDDITREAIAKTMGVDLVRDPAALRKVQEVFASRNRTMSPSNERQADVPVGATIIEQVLGTAPGLICPIGEKVIYAMPGVPHEMHEMLARAVIPDLERRAGMPAVIRSRVLRTTGLGESVVAERVAPVLEALDAEGPGAPTVAFLASGIEGIKVRITVKCDDDESATASLDRVEEALRRLLGDVVFGLDDETMEHAIGKLLLERHLSFATAESVTGGLIASRVVAVPGASAWFRGSLVSYASELKYGLLGVAEGPVVSLEAAAQMAEGARSLLGADVVLSTTGVAGPDPQDGVEPGRVFVGIALPGAPADAIELSILGGRNRMREMATISALDQLRRRLLQLPV
jgi:nicotinamide-nucleotide amidase